MKKTTISKIKSKYQALAVNLSKNHRHLCLEWSTGVGKSLAAIKIAEDIIKSNPKAKGYLICKESTHLKNWEDEFKKHKKRTVMNKLSMFLYASLHKYNKPLEFIILDECHALTDKRVQNLKPLIGKSTKVILLSATIPQDKKDLIRDLLGPVRYDKISLIKAIKLGLLPEPTLVVHKMKLEPKGSYEFVFRKGKGKVMKHVSYANMWPAIKKYPKTYGITVKCNELQYYSLITKQMAYMKDMMIKSSARKAVGLRNKFLNLGSQRKKFIAKVKTDKTAMLVDKLRRSQKRFICFCGTIDQSLELGAKSSVNSRNDSSLNEEIIECFNQNQCDELFAVKMLREGVNLTNIEKGVIVQLDSTVGSFFQMFGRCLRHKYPEMHLIVIEHTQDEVYFKNAMEDFDDKFVKYAIQRK